ncbi:MAG: cytochrome c [Gammaproteobacteria bacterium]
MKRAFITLLGASAILTGAAVVADPKPEDAVEYRQGIMMAMGWNVGPMGAMAKGEIPFDAERFSFHATRVAVLAQMAFEGFPPSSKSAESHAKAAMWDNYPDFEERMKKLEDSTARLAEIAEAGDKGATLAQFGDTVKVCKGCHDEYQEEH